MMINFFAKDPSVFPPRTLTLPDSKKVRRGPSDNRIKVRDIEPAAVPDRQGNFLYDPDDPQFDACEPYGVLRLGMDLYEKILERDLPFAFPGKVTLLPHDDQGINAFYSRDDRAVHFLEMSDGTAFKNYPEIPNADLRMAQSLDVGAHEEVGHLLLDGLKPDYLNMEIETQAFHEAFGDISAMIVALQFNEVIARMVEETAGDLRKSNVVSRLGKEAGVAIQALSPHPDPRHYFLRDASFTLQKDWKYVPPEKLTEWNPKDESKLGSEPHNFSRFFSGVWYEVFVNLYEQDSQRKTNSEAAARNARDIAARLIVRAVGDFAPETTGRYSGMAKAMLQADRVDYQGAHEKTLATIFAHRGILSEAESREQTLAPIKMNLHLKNANSRFAYKNRRGETYITFYADESRPLQMPERRELHGVQYRAKGSVKLGFDKNGQLFHVASDLVTPAKHERIHQNLRQCHENEYIAISQPGVSAGEPRHYFKTLSQHHKVPYFAYTEWKNGKARIERVPVFA